MSNNILVKKILILAANPKNTSPLRLDEEVREIAEGLKRAQKRDRFILEQRWAVRPRDIQRAMLEINPQIIHFSGHGAGDSGLIFEDELGKAKSVSGEALAELFGLFCEGSEQPIECVILNGCYTEVQAQSIARKIPYVIGMDKAIGDRAAIEFAVGFYDALGAGRSVEFAYRLGCNAILIAGIAENLTPVLIKKAGFPSPTPEPLSSSNGLTSGERQRLEKELNELRERFNSLSEEIQFLEKSERIDDLSPRERFRLQRQIEQVKEERQQLSERITVLEKKL